MNDVTLARSVSKIMYTTPDSNRSSEKLLLIYMLERLALPEDVFDYTDESVFQNLLDKLGVAEDDSHLFDNEGNLLDDEGNIVVCEGG